jgi:hypothetical protein
MFPEQTSWRKDCLFEEEVIKEEAVESFTSSHISGKYYYCDRQIAAYLF